MVVEERKAAIEEFISNNTISIEIHRVKHLNNIIEQDHRGVKRITNSTLGFKSFDSTVITLAGIETINILRKKQLKIQPISSKI